MNKTAIEWCDYTWNPITGCLHKCPYCYAEKITKRFGVHFQDTEELIHVIDEPKYKEKEHYDNGCGSIIASITPPEIELRQISYPFDFAPTFHRYRLDEPQHIKKSQNVFVCSMADLFGKWVPEEWIREVFEACKKAPQHRYLFLTKNSDRYTELNSLLPKLDNFWFGTTITPEENTYWYSVNHNFFVSIEPIMSDYSNICTEVQSFENIGGAPMYLPWVIIGAETGNRKGKVIPKREWIENIVNECRRTKTPVFLKSSLVEIWGEPLIQEFPWEGRENEG
jgi:protein gp37